MPNLTVRPQLKSFRVLAFHAENRAEASGQEVRLDFKQEVEVGLAVPSVAGASLMVAVRIDLNAAETSDNTKKEPGSGNKTLLEGEYEARFYYSTEVQEKAVIDLLEDEQYQYVLVSQAFPLAMSHFRREMQSLGLDSRKLPLGIA